MRAHRKGTDLRIQIRLGLYFLGRPYKGVTKGLTIAQMEAMLKELRREQIALGILKRKDADGNWVNY